ncbi:MAG: Spy/CpxP family protein refolding chaperone [Pseudomonadota bacterium]
MPSHARTLILTAVLAVAAAGVGAWLAASAVVRHRDQEPSLHLVVHRKLDLTPAQTRRLDALEASYAVERARLEQDIREANRELALAIGDGDKDSPRVEAAIDHLHMAMGALQKATVGHVFDMRAILTPAQARAFDAEVAAALTREDR